MNEVVCKGLVLQHPLANPSKTVASSTPVATATCSEPHDLGNAGTSYAREGWEASTRVRRFTGGSPGGGNRSQHALEKVRGG
jgi:hypothetical protein